MASVGSYISFFGLFLFLFGVWLTTFSRGKEHAAALLDLFNIEARIYFYFIIHRRGISLMYTEFLITKRICSFLIY